MPQVDKNFTAFWMDTSTAPGTPLTGLSATITIREVDTGTVVVNAEAMTNLGGGWYKYIFTAMAIDKDYIYICNPNDSRCYIESGVTDKRLNSIDANISDIRGGGGFSMNLSGVTTGLSNLSKKIESSKDEIIEKVETSKVEILESEKLDIKPIFNKIDSIEIPVPKEVDFMPVTRSIDELSDRVENLYTQEKERETNEKLELKSQHEEEIRLKDEIIEEKEQSLNAQEELFEEYKKYVDEEIKEIKGAHDSEKTGLMELADNVMEILEEENKSAEDKIWKTIQEGVKEKKKSTKSK